jgi:hypothetical protein
MNEKVLNTLENFFLIPESTMAGVMTFPSQIKNKAPKNSYKGAGIEFASVTKSIISISSFEEEYNPKQKINTSNDAFEVYLIDGNNLILLSLSNLFNSESYLEVLNKLVKIEAAQLGIPPSENFPQDTLIFDTKNFILFEEGLVLQLNPKAFEEEFDFNKKFGVLIPYEKMRSIVKVDGPLEEFYK